MLTQQAIEQSSEIEAINQQLALTAERQDYAESRQWTNYLTLDPVRLVQNVLGGGDVQRDRLAIAGLELETANLIRRREEVAEDIASNVVNIMLDYWELRRRGELLASQLETHELRLKITEASYRTGHGSTDSMLSMWQRTTDLRVGCSENKVSMIRRIQELEALIEEDLEQYILTTLKPETCALHWNYVSEPTFTLIGEPE